MTLHPRERAAEQEKKPEARTDKNSIDKTERSGYIDLQEVLPNVTQSQRDILIALEGGPSVADNLAQVCEISAAELLAELTMLEIQGYIQRLPGNVISLAEK